MVDKKYVPDSGHIVWIDFDPVLGHEQGKHRPALVISPKSYNQKSSLALMCPVTSKIKNYPFVVPVSSGAVKGAVLTDQIKSFDWQARPVKFVGIVDKKTLTKVRSNLIALIKG